MTEIAVLGGGPTGVMAALRAADAGHEVTLYEAADRIGGMAASIEVAGQRVDLGSHRLHPAADPALLKLVGDLLGDDLQVRPRNGRLRLGERWLGFPLRTGDLLRHLPPSFALGAARDTALAPLRRRDDTDFHSAVASSLGPTMARAFYGPYARKLYGVEPHELDAELARRRVSASSALTIARRLLRASRPAGRTFLYPRRGYGQIVEALADRAVDAGASIRLGSPVTGLDRRDDGIDVHAGEATERVATVVSTVPAQTLASLMAPPPCVNDALERCRTRGMILVYLVVPRPRWTGFDAHYLAGPDTTVARVSEPKNYRDGDDPNDITVLCAEIAAWEHDRLWRSDDGELGELACRDLARCGLADPTPVHVETHRLPSVYPVLETATMRDRATVGGWAAGLDGIVVAGRQGLAALDNLHHVLAMGSEAVGVIDDSGEIDRLGWRGALARFESHVVED